VWRILRCTIVECAGIAMRNIAVCTTRSGQTSTFLAASLAWTLAASRHVILVDCDMEGGTVSDLLFLDLDDRGLANCFGDRPANPGELAAQTVRVPDRPNLEVIPGLRGTYGFEMVDCLRRLDSALRGLDCDVVIVDLGHPFSHPGLRSSRAAAQAVCALFQRIFVVIRDEPALLARSIDVLQNARLSHGELVVCQQRSNSHQRAAIATLEREVPDLPIRGGWFWDEKKASRMADSGKPLELGDMVAELHL
jgi:MinD-like ATPase involved in chromosome partitioning or flagellar assembly